MTEAILLINMGGPARRNDVEPYLREIFSDPAIIDLPAIIRKPLASLIAMRRKEEVADRYEALGGYSPLFHWSEALRQNIIHELAIRGEQMEVAWAFRYMFPSIDDTMKALAQKGIKKVNILPLFPHYTHTMTGSVMKVVEHAAKANHLEFEYLEDWGQEEHVLELWEYYLKSALAEAGPKARVMFVAHGIPQVYVNRGDDYPDRVRASADKLSKRLPEGTKWVVAFQSKVGPVEWTKPYMEDALAEWTTTDDPIVMMPLSFVADCLETLYDLDDVAKKQVGNSGVKKYVRARVFNDDPRFASALLNVWQEKCYAASC